MRQIFRSYDIRGIFEQTLSLETAYKIGQSIASIALDAGETGIIIARDGRLSGKQLSEQLIAGITSTGCNTIDIGMVPTPMLYFATTCLEYTSGIMITGSHNPKDYNGFKIVLQGEALYGDAITNIYNRIIAKKFHTGSGNTTEYNINQDYLKKIASIINITRKLKIVIDCGNGVAGVIATELYKTLSCEVIELFCEVDGNFPNHHPDPGDPKNLNDLINAVKLHQADIGLAFDGDADRLGVVDASGNIINGDRLLMLFAKDLLTRQNNATIIYDVKCSHHVQKVIEKSGGNAIMWKTGHSLIKAKMRETNALLAGEMSGHLFLKENWSGADDALFAGAKLLEIITQQRSNTDVFSSLPDSVNTPEISIDVAEDQKFAIMKKIITNHQFTDAKIITIDGLRAEFNNGWGLIRCSNTSPKLVMRFEADNEQALEEIQNKFQDLLNKFM